MTLNFEHSLRGSSVRSAHARALYALFVGALSFLILTATMVFYSIMTPSAYAETSSTGGDASYYEEVFTLDEATGEITKTSVTRASMCRRSPPHRQMRPLRSLRGIRAVPPMLVAPLILMVFPLELPIPPS